MSWSYSPASTASPNPRPHTSGLAIATGSRYYLPQAGRWAHACITGPNDARDTLNLYDVSGLAHYDLVRAIRAARRARGLRVTMGALLADLRRQLDGPRRR